MNEQHIYNFLIQAGLTPEGACGVMGNLSAESGLSPTNLQDTFNKKLGMTDDEYTNAVDRQAYTNFVRDGAGYGIAQWTYWSRKRDLLEYARSAKTSVGDLDTQLGYLLQELRSQYTSLYSLLCKIENLDAATEAFLTEFEKPAGDMSKHLILRSKIAEGFFKDLVPSQNDHPPDVLSDVDWVEDTIDENPPEPEVEVTMKINGYTYTGYLQLAD